MILTSFVLDIYDGKVARAFNQCTSFGDGLDWSADIYINFLLFAWWSRLEPVVMPFLMIATMIEISAALFDFAIHAADRYPKRGR